MNNGANSLRNYSGRSVVFFDGSNGTGPGILFDSVQQGANYQDPQLSNGGGVGYGGGSSSSNWQDKISSMRGV